MFLICLTVRLNNEEIGLNAGRITKMKPFIDKYNWEQIIYPSEKDDWKKIEKNNVAVAKEKMYPAYVSKYNSSHKKQVILSMISKEKIIL